MVLSGCNWQGMLTARVNVLQREMSRPIQQACSVCVRDHLIWIPARHLPAFNYTVNVARVSGHSVLSYMLHAGLVAPRQVGFMFPADCYNLSPFFTMLQCLEGMAYRPLRQDSDGHTVYPAEWPDPIKPWPSGWRPPGVEPPRRHGGDPEESRSWLEWAGKRRVGDVPVRMV